MTQNYLAAGLIYGPEAHHLDHLGPLCCILGIPLIVTEEKLFSLAQRYYPGIDAILFDYLAIPEYLIGHFETVFYSMPRDLFDEIFFFAQKWLQKRIRAIWCPHGNSDKGEAIFYMEALKKEEAALLYGKQMIDFFKSKGVFDQLKGFVLTGNFRYQFYLKHQPFYDEIAGAEIARKLPRAKKTLLYAPTWKDYENSTSFFDAAKPLFETLPPEHNLIVKLHPNLMRQEEFLVEEIIRSHESNDHILFLTDFTPIHALLNLIDAYIGDASSIGYDFLLFQKPLFFLSQNQSKYLFRCGREIKPDQYGDTYNIISHYFLYELRDFSEMRKEVYEYAFGHPKSLENLKQEILQHLCATQPF